MKPIAFEESITGISGTVVLLDVDGTLVPDGEPSLSASVREAVQRLKADNTVFLASNGSDARRVVRFSEELGVNVVPAGTPAGKPFRRAGRGIPTDRPRVVIGDKLMTDGLFARNMKAKFIHTKSKRASGERLTIRLSYMVEAVLSWFL